MSKPTTYFVFALCAAAVAEPAQTVTTLHSFDGTDGQRPAAGLIQATDGELYGTAAMGGTYGYGTIFKITTSGTVTTLYSFCSQSECTDGAFPYAGLVQALDGDFYGTTSGGGANDSGTVFKIDATGTLTTLYSFCSQSGCTDGASPYAGLVEATNGDFYGTTSAGGAHGGGTVFSTTPLGVLITLYSFCSLANCTDGGNPEAALVQATDGGFYGTTFLGGTHENCLAPDGSTGTSCGTVFKITPAGRLTTLYSFCSQGGCADGGNPAGALIQAINGEFYGTTAGGRAYPDSRYCEFYVYSVQACGTVFKINSAGTLTTLYDFACSLQTSYCPAGYTPEAGLVQAANGDLFGTTAWGGGESADFGANYGTIFAITAGDTLRMLYSFGCYGPCPAGWYPTAPLVQATNGEFYGTTQQGGANDDCDGSGCGTVFSLSVGQGPFVKTTAHLRQGGRSRQDSGK
jgi:uncharacterized repeat protein (TIGR03803 family)